MNTEDIYQNNVGNIQVLREIAQELVEWQPI